MKTMESNQGHGASETPTARDAKTMKVVYAVTERGGRSYWTRVGVGYENRDGSLNLKLDAIPVNGTLQVREWEPFDRRTPGAQSDAFGGGARTPIDPFNGPTPPLPVGAGGDAPQRAVRRRDPEALA